MFTPAPPPGAPGLRGGADLTVSWASKRLIGPASEPQQRGMVACDLLDESSIALGYINYTVLYRGQLPADKLEESLQSVLHLFPTLTGRVVRLVSAVVISAGSAWQLTKLLLLPVAALAPGIPGSSLAGPARQCAVCAGNQRPAGRGLQRRWAAVCGGRVATHTVRADARRGHHGRRTPLPDAAHWGSGWHQPDGDLAGRRAAGAGPAAGEGVGGAPGGRSNRTHM
jgi:hypothetical protein